MHGSRVGGHFDGAVDAVATRGRGQCNDYARDGELLVFCWFVLLSLRRDAGVQERLLLLYAMHPLRHMSPTCGYLTFGCILLIYSAS